MKKETRKIVPIFLVSLMIFGLFSAMVIATSNNTAVTTAEDLHLTIVETFKNPKMESAIAQIVAVSETKPAEVQSFASAHDISIVDDKIRVVLELTDAKASLKNADIEVETTYKNLVQALVPISELKEIARDPAVQYIRLPLRAYPMITSEGVGVIGADKVHAAGIKGDDVKVAVINGGFKGYATNPEIPSANIVEVKSFRADGDIEADSVHGTACAEVVLDVAPNASLYLFNFETELEFEDAVNDSISKDVDIISCSMSWFYGPFDGTGLICEIASNASTNGILFVNSAGNSAQRHWEGAYDEGTIIVGSDTWYVHKFATEDVTNSFDAYAGEQITVTLSWNDWPQSDQDFDLFLVNEDTMAIVRGSENVQNGSQSPFEAFIYEVPSSGRYGILIREYSAINIVDFEVYSFYHNLEYKVEESSITIPADAESVMAVGATYWSDDSLESFSSRGPTNDGRTKPDVVAPDGVSTYAYGSGNFYGTSASAPHVAGAAALLLDANSSLTADLVQSCLDSTAVDLGASGKDNLYGSGRIDVWAAYQDVTTEKPDIWVDPTSFEVTLPPNTSKNHMLKIGNAGNATLTYSIIDDGSWLDEDPKSGSVEPGDYEEINVTINTTGLSTGDYYANITISNNDPDENPTNVPVNLTVCEPEPFDTGPGTYPSIMGTHNGTITPNQTINITKMYTYPCSGTGGHSETVTFYNDTAGTGSVLIIDNDNDANMSDDQSVDMLSKTFTEIGYNVTIEESVKTLNSTWSNYDIIVWSSGDDLTPLRHETFLFGIVEGAQEVEDDLNNGIISEILKEKFETKGFSISEDAIVTKKTDEHWVITDGERIYYVKNEGIGLKIYLYSEDKNKLIDYVTDGGHLILEGGNIAWECRVIKEFAAKVLHIPSNKFVYSDVGDLTLSSPQHPLATTPNVLPENISFSQDKPGDLSGDADAVRILPNATGVFNWSYVAWGGVPGPESVGLIAYDNDEDVTKGGQIVYYAFDIDDIDDPDIQRELIENSENWLRVVKGAEIANGTWTGYQGAGDYHYIVFEKAFKLEKDVTYNYTIRTGSYPQIHHTPALPTVNGWINCTKFTDANGNEYTDRIPAIRLE